MYLLYIIKPPEPDILAQQLRLRDNVSSIDDKKVQRKPRKPNRIVNRRRQCRKHAIQRRNTKRSRIDEQEVDEELPSVDIEFLEEVHDDGCHALAVCTCLEVESICTYKTE